MKKSLKITLIVVGVLIGIVLLDTLQARILKHSPIISWKEELADEDSWVDRGILMDTYYCTKEKDIVTVSWKFKGSKFTCPIDNVTLEDLRNLQDEVLEKLSEYEDYTNNSAICVDEEKNVLIIELVDNSKEEQDWFRENIMDSEYIKFEQGGPYTTSAIDFYIHKPEFHNDIRFNDYYKNTERTIYLAGNIEEFYVKTQDRDITLKTYLSTAYQTIDDGIKSITDELELKVSLKDGGTKIYKSKDKDITMIVCNTIKGDKNVLIGDYSLEYTEGDCKN